MVSEKKDSLPSSVQPLFSLSGFYSRIAALSTKQGRFFGKNAPALRMFDVLDK